MEIAKRNREIKKILAKAFGCKVTVRGHRGTSYGWVTVNIDYTPTSTDQARELRAKVLQLLAAAKIEIGTYGYDDPGSDYGFDKEIHVNFNEVWDWQNDFNYVGSRHHY